VSRSSKLGLKAKDLKAGELYGVLLKAKGEADPYSDEAIMDQIYAAEDFYEHDLHTRFKPTRVISDARLRESSIDPAVKVTDFNPAADIEEPAYQYDKGLFNEDRWADIPLGWSPIIRLTKVFFWYPGTAIGSSWQIPLDWMRLDRQMGQFQIVPASGPLLPLLSLNTYVLGALAGGRSIPNSLFIDYDIGFEAGELDANHRDLIKGVSLIASMFVFGVASVARTGGAQSLSLSLDGLSRSGGYGGKYGAYSGQIELAKEHEERIRENWKSSWRPVPAVFV